MSMIFHDETVIQVLAFSALFVAGQGVSVLLLILSSPRKHNIAHYLLAGYIGFNCFIFIVEYFIHTNIRLPGTIYFLSNIYILEGGFFYLYVKALVEPYFRLRWQYAIHLSPLLIFLPYAGNASSALLPGYGQVFGAVIHLLYYALLVGYCIASARLLPPYAQFIRGNFSSIDGINLDWLYKLIVVYLLSSCIFLIVRVLELYAFLNNPRLEMVYVNNTMVYFICFYLIALGGYRQKPLQIDVEQPAISENSTSSSIEFKPKYYQALADEETRAEIWEKLNSYMQQDTPFLDSELNLYRLAKGIGVSSYMLSQVLNSYSGQSFYDFVNAYRAEKAKEMIEDGHRPDLSMLAIGMESGFANKMTFYKHFKKRFSKTPLQYKKALVDS